jgi:hypothetical protein
MKRLLSIAAVALVTSGFFAPAANAQNLWNNNINMSQSQLQARVNMGIRTGALSRREANNLQIKLNRFADIERSMRRNGLSFRERNALSAQLSKLSREINRQLMDTDRRWNRTHTRPYWYR